MENNILDKFNEPDNYGNNYVNAIEESLMKQPNSSERITLEHVQDRFKDYKNSECIQKRANIKPGDKPIDAMREYRRCESKFDCDASGDPKPEETVRLYYLLWPDLVCEYNYYNGNNEQHDGRRKCQRADWEVWCHAFRNTQLGIASGDTINSFSQIFMKIMGCKSAEQAFKKHRDDDLQPDLKEQVSMFACLTHTAGNFIPMPHGFNPIHGAYPLDRWDFCMEDIAIWYKRRNWTDQNNKKPNYKWAAGQHNEGSPYMRFADPDYANVCKKQLCTWLDSFKENERDSSCFETFVRKNFLHDYYDFGSHKIRFYDEHLLPHKDEQGALKPGLLIEVNARIIARNIRMHKWAENPKNGVDKKIRELIFGW